MPKTQGKVAFVGCGYSHLARFPEKSEVAYAVDACKMAADDAGMDPAQIDGIAVQFHHYPPPDVPAITQGIGMQAVNWQGTSGNGMGPAGIAATAIDSGQCRAVLIVKIMNTVAPVSTPQIDPQTGAVGGPGQFEVPYGLGYSMQRIGLRARRYMHRYGITSEQVGWVCVVQREGALLNPWAYMKTPLTIDDYMNSRWIADPVHVLDCDYPLNGAFACLMTRADIAKDLQHRPVYLRAWSQSQVRVQDHLQPEILEGMSPMARVLYDDAGLGPQDMDLWYMYDGFSFFVLHWMENLGLVGRGEAGAYVDGGERIRINGEHPMNTHGGALSEGRMHGMGYILEAVQQLRGNAGARQTKASNTAIISSVFPDTGSAGILTLD